MHNKTSQIYFSGPLLSTKKSKPRNATYKLIKFNLQWYLLHKLLKLSIIHQVNAMGIITVSEIWIPDLN